MSKPVISIEGSSSVRETTKLMTEKNIGSILIYEDNRPAGIVTERDILVRVVAKGHDPDKTAVREIMSSPLISINRDSSILDAMRYLREKEISRLVIMHEDDVIGIVSERDLIRACSISSLSSFSSLLRKK
jgi:signal-transduction protein with cAMP-binding, CBS, and nucleotidyltransferase domain